MKIELIIQNFIPEIVGGSIRAYHFCNGLTKKGHSIHVVTMKKKGDWLVNEKEFPLPENCFVYRNSGFHIPYLPPGSGYVPLFLKSALKVIKKNNIDIIHGASPTIAGGLVGYFASKITNKPFVFEVKDPWIRTVDIDTKVYGGAHINEKTIIGKLYSKIEEKLCIHAKKIIVTNPAIREELLQLHPMLPKDKFQVIYSAADFEEFKVKPKQFDKFTILYTGVIYMGRATHKLIEAAEYLDDMQIIIAGFGPKEEIERLQNLIKKKKLEHKVKYLGLVPPKELPSLYLGADVFFVGAGTSQVHKYRVPFKIFNYMAAGKPLVATGVKGGDLDFILNTYKCGKMIYSAEPKEIAKAINFFRSKKTATTYGRRAKNAIKQEFNRKIQIQKLEKVYEEILQK